MLQQGEPGEITCDSEAEPSRLRASGKLVRDRPRRSPGRGSNLDEPDHKPMPTTIVLREPQQ